jgi:hypothetical protein
MIYKEHFMHYILLYENIICRYLKTKLSIWLWGNRASWSELVVNNQITRSSWLSYLRHKMSNLKTDYIQENKNRYPTRRKVEPLCYRPEGCTFNCWWDHWLFQLHYGTGFTQPKREMNFPCVKGGHCMKLTSSLPPVSRLSRKCERLDTWLPYGSVWPHGFIFYF